MDKIPVSGLISPIYESDKYPVIDPRLGIDGMRSLNSLQEMYDLPLEKRRGGMVVAIPDVNLNNALYYSLKPEGNGVTWSVGSAANWYSFLTSTTGSNAVPVKYNIANETITVPLNYEYLLWGNMTVATGGYFVNDGKAFFINGTVSTNGGTVSGSGQFNYISVPKKFIQTFTCSPFGVTISHNLGTEDIVYSVRATNNFVTVNMEILNSNQIAVTSHTTFSDARITVIG